MIFQKKLDRAMDWLKNQNQAKDLDKQSEYPPDEWYVRPDNDKDSSLEQESTKESHDTLDDMAVEKREIQESDFEKKDFAALLISAFLVFMPVAIIVLLVIVLLAWIIV